MSAADRLRGLAAEATPGPWWYDGRDVLTARVSGRERSLVIPLPETFHNEQEVRPADARLIALAPDLAVLLADMAEALEAVRDWVRDGAGAESDAAEAMDSAIARLDALLPPAQESS